jgi:hypothetical protein
MNAFVDRPLQSISRVSSEQLDHFAGWPIGSSQNQSGTRIFSSRVGRRPDHLDDSGM